MIYLLQNLSVIWFVEYLWLCFLLFWRLVCQKRPNIHKVWLGIRSHCSNLGFETKNFTTETLDLTNLAFQCGSKNVKKNDLMTSRLFLSCCDNNDASHWMNVLNWDWNQGKHISSLMCSRSWLNKVVSSIREATHEVSVNYYSTWGNVSAWLTRQLIKLKQEFHKLSFSVHFKINSFTKRTMMFKF